MAYVITEPCVSTCDQACVKACPVDAIHGPRAENPRGLQLYIDPDNCICCAACEPECPVEAIKPDTEPGLERWLELNREYSETWPNITAKKAAPADADSFRDEKGKFEKFFSPKPGEGD